VLDFGLARHGDTGGRLNVSNSPTVMVTAPGVILGTAAYMSPEKAKGNEADRSSDVWAFGCVLYEMLTAVARLRVTR
jgi:serine/threonine-protein kinase